MKKWLRLVLCLALALCCAGMGSAEEETAFLNIEDMGMKLTEPAAFTNQEGLGFFVRQGIVSHDPFFSAVMVNHIAFPVNRVTVTPEGEAQLTEAEQAGISTLVYPLMAVFVTTSLEYGLSLFTSSEGLNPVEFAQKGDFHYYYVTFSETYLEEAYADLAVQYPDTYQMEDLDKWKAEAERMRQGTVEALKAAEVYEPVDPTAKMIGQTLQFETVDLDGNAVKSGDLFSGNRMTMINVWGTWCPNCLNEMKDLGDIHRKLQEQGCGILGLEYEGGPIGAEVRERALSILSENGCAYPNVVKPEGNTLLDSLIGGYPTTIFVDSNGKILTFPIAGADVASYERTIEKLLSGGQTGEEREEAAAPASDAQAYRVFVTDGSKPVEGVFIQFCSNNACFLGKTDAEGMALFEQPEGEYEIHVLKTPVGYAPDQTVYKTPTTYGDVHISLNPLQ